MAALRSHRIIMLTALLAQACGGSAEGDPKGSAPVLPDCPPDALVETTHANVDSGTYSVPVPPELEPFASYPVGSINFCWRGDRVTLGYKLPELLLGKAEHVSFTGPWLADSERFELSSEDGTGSCERSGSTWTCSEQFAAIAIDHEELHEELQELPSDEIAARLQVSERFGQDPIGILTFVVP